MIALLALAALAHPLAPSGLEVDLRDGVEITWRSPATRPEGVALHPSLPASCAPIGAPSVGEDEQTGALWTRQHEPAPQPSPSAQAPVGTHPFITTDDHEPRVLGGRLGPQPEQRIHPLAAKPGPDRQDDPRLARHAEAPPRRRSHGRPAARVEPLEVDAVVGHAHPFRGDAIPVEDLVTHAP